MSTGPDVVAVRKDGSTVAVDIRLVATTLPDGPAVVATIRDVSATRELQRHLSETNDLFGSVLTAATEQAIIATDAAGLITLFNAGAEKMLEYAARAERVPRAAGLEVIQAEAGLPEAEEWTYVAQDQRRIPVQVSV